MFSSFFMYLTISVSEWWMLNTEWVMNGVTRSKGDCVMLPSILEAEVIDSAIWTNKTGMINNNNIGAKTIFSYLSMLWNNSEFTCTILLGQANIHRRSRKSSLVVVSSNEIPTYIINIYILYIYIHLYTYYGYGYR